MNLALLSNQDSDNGKQAIAKLLSSTPNSSKPGVFFASQPDPDRHFYGMVMETYQSMGFNIDQYLDFEEGYSAEAFEKALSKPFIHLSGGNTFRFLHSIKQRGAEARLVEYANNGGILIGVSAGAMILTPSIESAYLCGDQNHVNLQDLTGLSLTPFLFDPHSDKRHGNVDRLETSLDLLMASDDDGCVVINGEQHFIGDPLLQQPVEVI